MAQSRTRGGGEAKGEGEDARAAARARARARARAGARACGALVHVDRDGRDAFERKVPRPGEEALLGHVREQVATEAIVDVEAEASRDCERGEPLDVVDDAVRESASTAPERSVIALWDERCESRGFEPL